MDQNYDYDDMNMDYEQMEYDDDEINYYIQEDYFDQGLSPNKYQILPQSTLFFQLQEIVNKTMEMTALSFGWSLLILRQFKWNYQYASEYFQNPQKYLQKIGYSKTLLPPNQLKNQYGTCMVCCDEGKLVQNICGQIFCLNCWSGHLQQSINSLNPFPKCMGCQVPLLSQFIENILSQGEENKKFISRYHKLLCQLFSTANTSYQCCPGIDCTNCIKCQDYNVTSVKCTCGKGFCFRCKNDDHSPCSCEERQKWLQMVLKEEADAKWMSLNTKICPWCNKAVERSAGCNYMACLCGKSFCYMCSKPWQPDHKDHFKCHIFKKKDDSNVDKEKAILEKMNFYAEKYLNANRNSIELKKIDTFQKRKKLFQILSIDLTDSDFIDQAYKFAIECCQSLKWIYVYSYFVKFKSQQKKQAIDFTQGQYECYKEQLLKKLAIDLKNFLIELENKKLKQQLNVQDMKDQFYNLRKNITNYYTCTRQFKEKFVEQLQKIDHTLIKRASEDKKAPENPKTEEKKGKGQKRRIR